MPTKTIGITKFNKDGLIYHAINFVCNCIAKVKQKLFVIFKVFMSMQTWYNITLSFDTIGFNKGACFGT